MDKILDAIAAKEQTMLRFLESLVNIDSGIDNPEGIDQVARLVGGKLAELGFAVEYLEYPGACTHVLARKKGTGDKQVMIMGHMDTVFPKGTAAARPFTVKDGKAYGPGVLDMKGGITAALFALEAMYEHGWNDKNITVFFCGDEETAHPKTNAVEIFEREARGKDAVFNMESGRPDGGVVIGRKGVIIPELTVKGRAAHAGNEPEKGASAVLELAYKTIDLHNLTNPETGTTVNVGVFRGGVAQNVVPPEAYAKVDIRFTKVEEAEKVLQAVREIAARTYVPGTETVLTGDEIVFMPMETTDKVLSLFKLVQEQGRKLGIEEIGGFVVGGGSDAAWTTRVGAPTVCSMGPRGGLNHSEREYIEIDGLIERAKLLALCIDAV
ncbi:peptidase dimerisation domain protein [Thermosinus carboxydivorans Nor1]|uniref:Peptidase dimerisation domain protein n=1 Tax=Thermosinus carboxydivorans Nor1 TaxID=401526 RepID=A1HLS5_9FIRM|nr:M20 family metallopeptidase [Thermosinus carboxydivorans]EAX48780.1 peptidase dimerisation domain protein [Thermosinus carboxydivorans Nor1]